MITPRYSFETRIDPAGRPGTRPSWPGTGPGLSKNLPGSWSGKTRTTRAYPVETRSLLFLYIRPMNAAELQSQQLN